MVLYCFFQKSGTNKINTVKSSKRPTNIKIVITFVEKSENPEKLGITPEVWSPIPTFPMESAEAENAV